MDEVVKRHKEIHEEIARRENLVGRGSWALSEDNENIYAAYLACGNCRGMGRFHIPKGTTTQSFVAVNRCPHCECKTLESRWVGKWVK